MIENFLSEKIFRKGLYNYLEKFKYGNANTEDLWKSLSEVSGTDVAKFMANWVTKIGYPVVVIEGTKEKGKEKGQGKGKERRKEKENGNKKEKGQE